MKSYIVRCMDKYSKKDSRNFSRNSATESEAKGDLSHKSYPILEHHYNR